jgi:hypothetical protein
MRKVVLVCMLAVGALGIGATAIADNDDGSGPNSARLNGYQEGPSVSTRGFGSFHVKINRNETADYVLSYRDMETPVSAAHIHFGQREAGGPVSVFLCRNPSTGAPGTPGQACPPESGTVRGTFTRTDIILQNPDRGIEPGAWEELIAAIKVGHTYANVHTSRFPGGEIRGQINDRDQKEYTGPPPFATGGGGSDNDD